VIAKAAKLHADLGLSWTMLGERFGVSATAMRKALVKCGKKPPEL
jgi:hypothetical protein